MKHWPPVLASLLIAVVAVPTQVAAAEIDVFVPFVGGGAANSLDNENIIEGFFEFNLFGTEAQQRGIQGTLDQVKLTMRVDEMELHFSGVAGTPFASVEAHFHGVTVFPGGVGIFLPDPGVQTWINEPCPPDAECVVSVVNNTTASASSSVPAESLHWYTDVGTGLLDAYPGGITQLVTQTEGRSGVQVFGTLELQYFYTPIPEPDSLALVSLSLVGVVMACLSRGRVPSRPLIGAAS